MAAKQKIRIRLKAYDHVLLDQSAEKIVETIKKKLMEKGFLLVVVYMLGKLSKETIRKWSLVDILHKCGRRCVLFQKESF